MATITASSLAGSGTKSITTVTLNGSSDTFVYSSGAILMLHNPTGSPISPTIDGDGATTAALDGVGDVDISGGYDVGAIAAGATASIRLDTIRRYLTGTVDISSGTGLEGQLLTF